MRFAHSPAPIIPSAAEIRTRMRFGEDTRTIASDLFVPEADVWNTLALNCEHPRRSAGFGATRHPFDNLHAASAVYIPAA